MVCDLLLGRAMTAQELEQRATDLLLRLPITASFAGRSVLLIGLAAGLVASLSRDPGNVHTDIALIIRQLSQLGPLTGGTRPVLAVLEAGQRTVPGTALEKALASMIIELERAYGREEVSPPLDAIEGDPAEFSSNELLVFGVDRRLPFDFIDGANRAARAVARLQVTLPHGPGYGTAWLCGRDLLMTNRHVLTGDRSVTDAQLQDNARRAVAWFDYRIEGGSRFEATITALSWSDDKLDCAILDLEAGVSEGRAPLLPSRSTAQLDRGARLNIPQHPRGGPIRFAIRSNYYATGNEARGVVRYVTDTERGSSGSPVCDDSWAVVALHVRSAPIAPQAFPNGTAHYVNEGIAIDRIRAALPRDLADRLA